MNANTEVLLELHKVQVARSEHYERERTLISGLVLTLTSVLVGIATFDQRLTATDAIPGGLIVVCGVFGFVGARVYYFRSLRHGQRATEYRNALASAHPQAKSIARKTDLGQVKAGRKKRLRIHHVWSMLHVGVAIVGAALMIAALLAPAVPGAQ